MNHRKTGSGPALQERRFLRTAAKQLREEAKCAQAGQGLSGPLTADDLIPRLEADLVSATWTLRRLPDREAGFLRLRGALWPETAAEPGAYAPDPLTSLQARKRTRPTAIEIDRMQPTLDLLRALPEVADRRLLFWGAWHQNGETGGRIPWAKVRGTLDLQASRWTLKRRYVDGLRWLSRIVLVTS